MTPPRSNRERTILHASDLENGHQSDDRLPARKRGALNARIRLHTPIEIAHKTAAVGEAVYGSIAPITIGRCAFRGTGWPGSVQEMSWMNAASGAAWIVIVDDDLFRESLGLNLTRRTEGCKIASKRDLAGEGRISLIMRVNRLSGWGQCSARIYSLSDDCRRNAPTLSTRGRHLISLNTSGDSDNLIS
jgi:hypothetical protein